MKPLVYIAGPYAKPDPVMNTRTAIDVGTALNDTGIVTPIIPHLTLAWHLARPRHESYWYAYDLDVLAHCDALLRIQGESFGADEEVRFAETNGIPVYHDIDLLLTWAARQ